MREAFRISIVTFIVMLVMLGLGLGLVGLPRLISDDACLRDWDVECTSAGWFLQLLDIVGALLTIVATRMVSVVLVIVIAAEAVNYRKTAKRRVTRD